MITAHFRKAEVVRHTMLVKFLNLMGKRLCAFVTQLGFSAHLI